MMVATVSIMTLIAVRTDAVCSWTRTESRRGEDVLDSYQGQTFDRKRDETKDNITTLALTEAITWRG
jgi:hypothetical protein